VVLTKVGLPKTFESIYFILFFPNGKNDSVHLKVITEEKANYLKCYLFIVNTFKIVWILR